MTRYVDIRDLLQDMLDDAAAGSVETKVTAKENVDLLVEDFKTECAIVESSIAKLKNEIEGHIDQRMAVNVVISYENIIMKMKAKIADDIKGKVSSKLALGEVAKDAEYTDDKIIAKFGTFSMRQNTELDYCSMLLVRKSIPREEEESKPSLDSSYTAPRVEKPREQVFLEKTKPPRFNGDDLEFPDFKRKWASQVNKANLPKEKTLWCH